MVSDEVLSTAKQVYAGIIKAIDILDQASHDETFGKMLTGTSPTKADFSADIFRYMMFLATRDRQVSWEECFVIGQFMGKSDGITPTMIQASVDSLLHEIPDYQNIPPQSFRNVLDFERNNKQFMELLTMKAASKKLLSELMIVEFKAVGDLLICMDGNISIKELKSHNQYIQMMQDYAKRQQSMKPVENRLPIQFKDDELLEPTIGLAYENQSLKTSTIQRRFRVFYNRAKAILDALEFLGIIGPQTGGGKILMTQERALETLKQYRIDHGLKIVSHEKQLDTTKQDSNEKVESKIQLTKAYFDAIRDFGSVFYKSFSEAGIDLGVDENKTKDMFSDAVLVYMAYLATRNGTPSHDVFLLLNQCAASIGTYFHSSQAVKEFGEKGKSPYKVLEWVIDVFRSLRIPDITLARTLENFINVYFGVGKVIIALDSDNSAEQSIFHNQYIQKLRAYANDALNTTINSSTSQDSAQIDGRKAFNSFVNAPENLQSLLNELNNMVGLAVVKKEVTSLINRLNVQQQRAKLGVKQDPMSLHLVFSGNPGTGKTTVARLLARIYHSLGIVSKSEPVEAVRSDLVAGYTGQTAIKTREIIQKALGGVLFIDEAYTLTANKDANDFGREAVDTLLKEMEDHRDDLIVIVAGYSDLMEQFLDSNPGLRSRFNTYLHFEDYSPNELVAIFKSLCKKNGLSIDETAQNFVGKFFEKRYLSKAENFANAREVRNFYEKTISQQANRLAQMSAPSPQALMTLTIEDVKAVADDTGEQEDIQALLHELDGLIGLATVKKEVRSLINLLDAQKKREKLGIKANPMSLHLVFSGNPGTGKTTVARLLARIYHSLGVVSKSEPVEVARSDLVAGYTGQTAIQTQKKIQEARGGVLFIDEAYTLTANKDANDFGQEAVDTLLKEMEDHRDDLIVIVAGYSDLMEQFLDSNPGLRSRFKTYIHFEDYTPDELAAIFKSICAGEHFSIDTEVEKYVHEYFEKKYQSRDENFANARTVRNYFEKALSQQANRLAQTNTTNAHDLTTLKLQDVKDYNEDMEQYREAAANGDIDAMREMGFRFENGYGVEQDYEAAMQWYLKAAEAGDADAMQAIAQLYNSGQGVQQDYVEAMKWYRKAAGCGNFEGMEAVGYYYWGGFGVQRDYAEALKWFNKAIDNGSADGYTALGIMYRNGQGVQQDYHEAMRLFRKSVDLGGKISLALIGDLYAMGLGVSKDYSEAMKWYQKAGEKEKSDIMLRLINEANTGGQGISATSAIAVEADGSSKSDTPKAPEKKIVITTRSSSQPRFRRR